MRLACTALSSWFEKSATFVVPSPLHSAAAVQHFSYDQIEHGIESWERPPIHSLDAWLEASWLEARYRASETPTLLSRTQEQLLWHRIVEREQPGLFDFNATAQLAGRAARLLAEWRIPSESDLWSEHQDAQQFLEWRRLFNRKCREEGWITRSDVWRLLPSWLAKGLFAPEPTVFAAFATAVPALERVRQALGPLAAVASITPAKPRGPAPVKSCDDFSQEIELAARWARATFEQKRKQGQSIGVFVPDLATNRALVERVFQQVFYPSAALRTVTSEKGMGDCVFHLNAAASLGNHPLVASALLLLELARPRIDYSDACAILRCPFVTDAAEERSARAMADLDLRKRRELDVSLRDMEFAARNCPRLARLWSAIRRAVSGRSQHLELAAWSAFISDLLKAVGWPGDSELTLREREILEKWKDALSTLASLGLVSEQVSYDAALAHLRRLVATAGLDRGDWLSPIQILEASDAPGLAFDCAFVTGLSEDAWPRPLEISPLVPLKLQRAHQVPGSSPQSAQLENQRRTDSLLRVAPVLFATHSGRLSPVAEPFVTRDVENSVEYPRWQGKLPRQSYTPASLVEMEDTNAPRYQPSESTRGGAGIIRSQSLCPFRGFAEFRLSARAPDDACLGFDSRDRGGFLHKALQSVWESIKTQHRLLSMPSGELRTLVRESVNGAVADGESNSFHKLASQIERERLEELILQWLAVEGGRKQPFTVEMVEEKRYYEVPGLQLGLRVDRMDRLKNGKLLLIDYKSGPQTRGKLKCPRPPEPQLLVYAAAVGDEVEGVFFGEIKPRDPRAVGFSREKHFAGSAAEVKKDWDSFRAESNDEVRRIANEFIEGYAAIDPVHNACEYCGLQPLCRVNERVRTEQEDE